MGRSTHRYSERKSPMSQKDFEVIQPLTARQKKKKDKRKKQIYLNKTFYF